MHRWHMPVSSRKWNRTLSNGPADRTGCHQRQKITAMPLTDTVKNAVESMGTKQGFETLHNCTCWAPIGVADMNANKRRRAQLALVHLIEKSSREIKGQLVFNRKPTRECLGKEKMPV